MNNKGTQDGKSHEGTFSSKSFLRDNLSTLKVAFLMLFLVEVARGQQGALPLPESGGAANLSSVTPIGNSKITNAPPTLFDGSGDDNLPVPVDLRPFQLSLTRGHLFGEWEGLLPQLEDMGITPTLTYVSDPAGNPTGGRSQGLTYVDNIGLGLIFDLDKWVGWDGASFLISMSEREGKSLSRKYIGNVFDVQEVYGGETFHLIDLAYQQKLFDERIELSLGRIAAGDDFLVSQYDYLFMQNGFDGNPVAIFFNSPGMSAYPNATWGSRLKFRPTKRTYVMAGVYNGDSSIRETDHHGTDMSINGPVFAIVEAGYRRNGLPGDTQLLGNYKVGAWYDNDTFTDFRTVGYASPLESKRGNQGFFGLFDQVLLPFAEPSSNRGFGVFGSVLVSPDQAVSEMPYFFTAGLAARGIFASRPTDVAGFGVVFGEFSSALRDAEEREQLFTPTIGAQNHEAVLEWTYRFNLNSGAVFFQPDLQYVIRPGGTGQLANAVVLGCQLGVNF